MKSYAVAVTLAALFAPSPSPGDAAAALGGSVVDAATGRPLAGIAVEVAGHGGRELRMVITDKHGYFVIFGLDPDRYAATAGLGGAVSCSVVDVASGQMRRVRIAVGSSSEPCAAGRSAGSLVDPDETADVYRIH